jgi:hypothetical protein
MAADLAVARKAPLIVFSASGGARMQEGILSLMQLTRTTIAVRKVKQAGLPYIVVLTDPTTGGVSASFAMLGDVHLAEPDALIGFAGPRVIQDTIRQELPQGFQRAEYLLEHGMVDAVVHRHKLRETLVRLVSLLMDPVRREPQPGCRGPLKPKATTMTDAILDRLMRLHPKLIDLELGRIERLLADVGSPHLKLPPVVHVAGTNGKGSLVAYLRAMAEAAGYRVHVYTSPHLVRFNERIRVAGELISDDMLEDVLDRGRAGQQRAADHLLRDHDGIGIPRLRPRAGRPRQPRGRHGRPQRHYQRGRARALGHHADRLRPHELPRRHAGEDRGGEGGHPEARRAGGDRPPTRGECRRDRQPGGRADRSAVSHGPRMAGQADRARLSL